MAATLHPLVSVVVHNLLLRHSHHEHLETPYGVLLYIIFSPRVKISGITTAGVIGSHSWNWRLKITGNLILYPGLYVLSNCVAYNKYGALQWPGNWVAG